MGTPLSFTSLELFAVCPRKGWDVKKAQGRKVRRQNATVGLRLGQAAHSTLEALVTSSVYPGAWRSTIREVWMDELRRQHEQAEAVGDRLGPPEQWRDVAAIYVGLRKCLQVLEPTIKPNCRLIAEWEHTTSDGALHGLADLVIEGAASARIIDLKTGSYELAPDMSVPPRQLALYAALWRDSSAVLPLSVELLRTREGDHLVFEVSEGAVADALAPLEAAHRGLASPERPTGQPGDACRSCNSLGSCEDGMRYVEEMEEGVVTATVISVEADDEGNQTAIKVTVQDKQEEVWLLGLDRLQAPKLKMEDCIVVLRAHPNPGAGTLVLRPWSHIVVMQ
jgi:hypothetical protein